MDFQFIRYEKKDRTAYVTIHRPEVLNALHPPASAEVRRAFHDFRDDPDLWVAVLTGSGDRAFCAGNDLKYHAQHVRPGDPYPEADAMPFGGITSRFTCWKPIIGALNGLALGGGLELAMACDILVASDRARFGLPEPRVGVVATAGGAHRLPRLVPRKVAMGMLMTGDSIDAHQALRWGLVNEVVPLDDLMPAAGRWADRVLECAPLAVRASKQMAVTGLDRPLGQAMAAASSELEKALYSRDYREGPRAFAAKKKPRWKGA